MTSVNFRSLMMVIVFLATGSALAQIKTKVANQQRKESFRFLKSSDLVKLDKKSRLNYFGELANFLDQVETLETAIFSQNQKTKTSFLQALVPVAIAQSPGAPCIYAGYMSTRGQNGFCTPVGNINSTQTVCNPQLFGPNVIVPTRDLNGKSGLTRRCAEAGMNQIDRLLETPEGRQQLDEIIPRIEEHLVTMEPQFREYCASPIAQQRQSIECSSVRDMILVLRGEEPQMIRRGETSPPRQPGQALPAPTNQTPPPQPLAPLPAQDVPAAKDGCKELAASSVADCMVCYEAKEKGFVANEEGGPGPALKNYYEFAIATANSCVGLGEDRKKNLESFLEMFGTCDQLKVDRNSASGKRLSSWADITKPGVAEDDFDHVYTGGVFEEKADFRTLFGLGRGEKRWFMENKPRGQAEYWQKVDSNSNAGLQDVFCDPLRPNLKPQFDLGGREPRAAANERLRFLSRVMEKKVPPVAYRDRFGQHYQKSQMDKCVQTLIANTSKPKQELSANQRACLDAAPRSRAGSPASGAGSTGTESGGTR